MGDPSKRYLLLWGTLLTGFGVLAAALVLFLERRAATPEAPIAEEGKQEQPTPALSESPELQPKEPRLAVAERREIRPIKAKSAPHEDSIGRSDLHGRVIDDLDRPLARVLVVATPARDRDLDTFQVGVNERTRSRRDLEATSSSDGTFQIESLQRGRWEVTARGIGALRSAPYLVDAPSESPLTIVLPRSAIVAGTVVDANRRPLAGADVHLLYSGHEGMHDGLNDRDRRVKTNAAGGFRFWDVLPGTIQLMASDAEHPESDWLAVTLAPGETHDDVLLEIGAGGKIEGVIDPALGEVAHRKINLYSFRGSIGWRETESDESGRFVIEGVIPQDYVIELRKVIVEAGRRTEMEEIRKNITVEDGRTTEVTFGAPARTVLVRGTITCSGMPLPGVEVEPYAMDGNEDAGTTVTTGLDGRYELTVTGPGDYRFSVSANYGSHVSFDRPVPNQPEVELSFEVPGGVISGRVIRPDGKPVRHAPITVTRPGSSDWKPFFRDDHRRMLTEEDGTFEFRLLAPGSYILRTPDGFQQDSDPPRVPFGRVILTDLVIEDVTQLTNLELRLTAEGRISGTVVDLPGTPVTDAWIRVLDARGISLSGIWETQTDATGYFEVWSIAPGTYTVRVRTQELDTTSAPLTVEAGKTAGTRIELR